MLNFLCIRRARGGPRRQVHERGVLHLRQEHVLVPRRRLGLSQEHQANAKAELPVEHANSVTVIRVSDTLRAYANGRKEDWDSHLSLRLGAFLHRPRSTPGPRLQLSPPHQWHRVTTTSLPASRRQTTRSGCARWRLRCGSCSRRRRPTGRRSSMRAASTRCSRSATGCCCGPRSCSTPPTSVSCARGGTVPSRCSPARAPTPTPSRCHVACAAARPSTSTASNPSLSVSGPRRPRGQSLTVTGGRAGGGAAAQPPPSARSQALPGALEGPHVR